MKKIKFLFLVLAIASFMTSCTTINKSMREPNTHVEFYKNDFTFSDQVTAEATQTLVFGIDFQRLFKSEGGNLTSQNPIIPFLSAIPVIGGTTILTPKSAEAIALYNLMVANPGYDAVFYPQYEVTEERPIGFRFLYRIKTVKVTARLGKLN